MKILLKEKTCILLGGGISLGPKMLLMSLFFPMLGGILDVTETSYKC